MILPILVLVLNFSFDFGFILIFVVIGFQTNRSAKLKQYKIDARREQWLNQGM